MRSKTVLIIDDDFTVHDRISSVLMRAGIDTVSAGNTTAAKAALDLCTIDAILVDTMLGREDGWNVLCELRRFSKAPALMLSDTDVGPAMETNARKLGASGVLQKPLVDAQLSAAVCALF